jgi:hypothetical protein
MAIRVPFLAAFLVCLSVPRAAVPQTLTGTVIGRVADEHGSVLVGAVATRSPQVLTGEPAVFRADDKRIVVRIDERTTVDAKALADAMERVARIYREADVVVTWNRPGFTEDEAGLKLTIVVTSYPLPSLKHGTRDVMGVAHPAERGCGRIAYVFFERVEQLTRKSEKDVAVVLAHVIAHELGHLLLPPSSHSRVGIMRASWSGSDLADAARGRLLFTSAQAAQMRARIEAEPLKGTLRGTVHDSSGAPVASARVIARHIERRRRSARRVSHTDAGAQRETAELSRAPPATVPTGSKG